MLQALETVVSAEGLSKHFGEVRALPVVTFSRHGPGFVGIHDPNGARKTTLLDLLEGPAQPSSSTVRLFGAPIDPYPRRRVGVVLQREVQGPQWLILAAWTLASFALGLELFRWHA